MLGLPSDATLLGLIARFDPMKDHPTFVTAARMLLEFDRDIHFVMAGRLISSQNRELMRLIEGTGAPQRFHLLGEREDVERITAALDIACSSSYGEGFPNVVAEAMACGVPCVVTDAGDSALLVEGIGRVVPREDPDAFARACREVLKTPAEQRQQLGSRARRRIEERYSVKGVTTRYETLYEELVLGAASWSRAV